MSYLVLALKWRPKNFDEIVGQAHVVSVLKNAILKDRLAHAYIFAGPRGVGKTTTARVLAKALNCKNSPTVTPCGICPSCKEIARGNSLDVLEIDGASNRGIDEIRALRENVKFAPVAGKYKIYIIDEVHQITNDGFNALLKTLEEPPDFVKFIFATTHPHKVPPTILSRCQRLDFRRIPVKEIVAQLKRISESEKINIEDGVLFTIAKASDGSLRDAESILDQLVSFGEGKISRQDAISVLGLVEEEALFEIADKIAAKDAQGTLDVLDRILSQGKDAEVFLNNLIEHFRNLMITKISAKDLQLLDLPFETIDKLAQQARAFTLEEIFASFNVLTNALELSRRLDLQRIPLEISLVKLIHGKKPVSLPQPNANININSSKNDQSSDGQKKDIAPVSDNKVIEEARSGGKTEISLEALKDSWSAIIEAVSKTKIYVGNYLGEGVIHSVESGVVTVAFPQNCSLHKELLEKKENRALIERIIKDISGVSLRVNFVLNKDYVKEEKPPEYKTTLEFFNGRLVKQEDE